MITRKLSKEDVSPFATVVWESRDVEIKDSEGKKVFEQKGCSFPSTWSDTASKVVASKYFRGQLGTAGREVSVSDLITRVTRTITRWGVDGGYFDEQEGYAFQDELDHAILHQFGTFNSPVWFNVGVPGNDKPQCSACFILRVEDDIKSILNWISEEGMVFKGGSGAGINISSIRSSVEPLSGGGKASGPIPFMKAADTSAGSIKSGGKTRRAAKMVIMNVDHPDIREFVNLKVVEEEKARALIAAGFDAGFNVPGGAYDSVSFQNANHSVRVSDEFMRAVESDGHFNTFGVTSKNVVTTMRARDMMKSIAEAAWACGDPGMQWDDTVNDWHTCLNEEKINASNPCSEYMFLDNTACNLASLNLMKFKKRDGSFDVGLFRHVVDLFILAQEIIVDRAGYPTKKLEEMSHLYRTLGLGYANLGALLMTIGLAYDSQDGRDLAASITAIMTGEAYRMSALIAEKLGPFAKYEVNKSSTLKVIKRHAECAAKLKFDLFGNEARQVWLEAYGLAEKHGVRNAQVSVLAPTGTIAFMMDCATTGVEPELALLKYKTLVGGGTLKLVNPLVKEAMAALLYSDQTVDRMAKYLEENGTLEGSGLSHEHLAIFDTSFPTKTGRAIHHMGHVKMMAAVQPFVSGAISKTINMPSYSTVQDVEDVYVASWKLGLKAIAIYRDGCKSSQPLSTKKEEKKEEKIEVKTLQRKMPPTRSAIVHEFMIGQQKGFMTVGLFEDGTPGELFVDISKEGSIVSGFADAFGIAASFCLQHGVPLEKLVKKFSHMKFEPVGFTGNPDVPFAHSIPDYIFRWLDQQFNPVGKTESPQMGEAMTKQTSTPDAPPCPNCGSLTTRSGTCHKCSNCGTTTGCS